MLKMYTKGENHCVSALSIVYPQLHEVQGARCVTSSYILLMFKISLNFHYPSKKICYCLRHRIAYLLQSEISVMK